MIENVFEKFSAFCMNKSADSIILEKVYSIVTTEEGFMAVKRFRMKDVEAEFKN
jgi:hypothetical protein